jgi:hypothetical protein
MTDKARRKTLVYLLAVVVLTIVIAVALPRLELKPGLPLPGQAIGSGKAPTEEIIPLPAITVSTFWKAVLGLLLAAGMVYNAYKLLREATWRWRDVLRSLLYIFIPVFVLSILLLVVSGPLYPPAPVPAETPPPSAVIEGPPLGAVPSILIWLVCLALAAALVALGLWLVLRRPAGPDRVKLEAERALQALKSGLDLRNVIVHCYWQMGQVLKQEQGLEMDSAMTAREFERLLEARGVPSEPVDQLTRLFEAARYGSRPPGSEAERQAVDCLTAIVRYSQAGGQAD